jgi:iron complex transport system substrate-binding protein
MNNDDTTRRNYVKYGGSLIGSGLLAGCTGNQGSGPTETNTTTDQADTATDSETDTSYEACIEPAGCITFEEVPETWLTYQGGWADMAFALGQRDGFLTAAPALMPPSFFFEPFDIDVPPREELTPLWAGGWDKEVFYELDPDVILIDPNYLHGTGWDESWDQSDTEEIIENVAPFFGNSMLRRREFHDYKLYTLYEGLERLAELFQERERYEALNAIHEEVQTTIHERLPSEGERPSVGLINGGSEPEKGEFYPMNVQGEGYEMKPYRDLEIQNAFPAGVIENGTADYETLLEVDPEIIIVHWGIELTDDDGGFSETAFREKYITPMEEDDVGSQLTAVQQGTIYPGAFAEQGPLVNLLQTEMTARQLYPSKFGEFDPGKFPNVPEDEQLFDRQRVSDIVNGDF